MFSRAIIAAAIVAVAAPVAIADDATSHDPEDDQIRFLPPETEEAEEKTEPAQAEKPPSDRKQPKTFRYSTLSAMSTAQAVQREVIVEPDGAKTLIIRGPGKPDYIDYHREAYLKRQAERREREAREAAIRRQQEAEAALERRFVQQELEMRELQLAEQRLRLQRKANPFPIPPPIIVVPRTHPFFLPVTRVITTRSGIGVCE